MPTYLRPDVYVEEVPSGSKPIEGVATSVAAFVGPALRGPVLEAVRVSNFGEYEDQFGSLSSDDDVMGLAVQAFYRNGGKAAYICRVVQDAPTTASSTETFPGEDGANALTVSASSPGGWGDELRVRIVKPDPDALAFDLEIGWLGDDGEFGKDESFTSLSMDPNDTRYAPSVVGDVSFLVDLSVADDTLGVAASVVGGEIDVTDLADFQFRIGAGSKSLSLNRNSAGAKPVVVNVDGAASEANLNDAADKLAADLTGAITALGDSYAGVTCTAAVNAGVVRFTLAEDGANASASSSLAVSGGELAEIMGFDSSRVATRTGADIDMNALVAAIGGIGAATAPFDVTVDGLAVSAAVDVATLQDQLTGTPADDGPVIAAAVQKAVRAVNSSIPRLARFTCSYEPSGPRFVVASGSASSRQSGVSVAAGTLASAMGLDAGTTDRAGRSITDGAWKLVPAENLGADELGTPLSGGSADPPGTADYASYFNEVLRKVRDVTTVLMPGEAWAADGSGNSSIDEARAHCESMQDRILLVDPPAGVELTTPGDVEELGLPTSKFTVLYYPWVEVENPAYDADTNPGASRRVAIAPSGFAAGIYSKVDATRGVWKAPAGVETALAGTLGLEFDVENAEQDVLNPLGVNCFRRLPGYGRVVWGARTLATKADPEWRYVPVRRTAIFIEDSIRTSIAWAVFEGNDTPLWLSLKANIGAFMDGLHRSGAFQGDKASDAYFVKCGLGESMTQGDIDAGRVVVLVGFAPLKPAEFVIVRVQQIVNQQ